MIIHFIITYKQSSLAILPEFLLGINLDLYTFRLKVLGLFPRRCNFVTENIV